MPAESPLKGALQPIEIARVAASRVDAARDVAAVEEPLQIRLNDIPFARLASGRERLHRLVRQRCRHGWNVSRLRRAVQVGSFAKEATAERLMEQLRAQGQDAFVMPVKSGGATLYRVRIGPTKDRARADAVLRDVRVTAPGAAVVAHP